MVFPMRCPSNDATCSRTEEMWTRRSEALIEAEQQRAQCMWEETEPAPGICHAVGVANLTQNFAEERLRQIFDDAKEVGNLNEVLTKEELKTLIERYKPESISGDPTGGEALSPEGLAQLTKLLVAQNMLRQFDVLSDGGPSLRFADVQNVVERCREVITQNRTVAAEKCDAEQTTDAPTGATPTEVE